MSLKLFCTIILIASVVDGEIKNIGWWRNAVFYQIYPRSFMDTNSDGIGDLNGITNKLEHFVESGIDGIWLNPIFVSPMIDFGYDISDYRDIDKTFGTMEDFEALIAKAKKLGIKVVLDFVPNHTSDKHEWFIKSSQGIEKYRDYYVWHRGRDNNKQPPNNWINFFKGSAWTYNANRDLWYLHQFEYRQPELNLSNPNVRQELEEILRFWLSKGIDGFRVDAVQYLYENDEFLDEPLSHRPGFHEGDIEYLNHIYTFGDPRNYDLVQSWTKVVNDWSYSHNEDEKILMTESFADVYKVTKYYNYGVDIPFNFFLLTRVNKTSKPTDFKKGIDDWLGCTPSNGTANWVVGCHDAKRLTTRYPGRADQMIMLSMILPGVTVNYYGEEIAMEDNFEISWEDTQDPQACNAGPQHYREYSRDPHRTPFQWNDSKNAGFSNASKTWLSVHNNYKELNLAKQKSQSQSHYKLYQMLTNFRRTSPALRNGSTETVVLNDNAVLVIIRKISDKGVILLMNFSNEKSESVNVSKYLPNTRDAKIKGANVESGIKWESTVNVSNIELPPKASVVIAT